MLYLNIANIIQEIIIKCLKLFFQMKPENSFITLKAPKRFIEQAIWNIQKTKEELKLI